MYPRCDPETRHAAGDVLVTHRHEAAYAALVVGGSYIENSVDGPIECVPGSLVLHPRFHAHGDRFGPRGARVLNLTLPATVKETTVRVVRVPELTEAAAVFSRAVHHLQALIAASSPQPASVVREWQAMFFEELRSSDAPITCIARRAGVSAAYASRSFLRSYGMPPQLVRRELRCRHALALLAGDVPLVEVAARSGFADQSHLSRTLHQITGMPPARLRRQIKSVQDDAAKVVRQ